MSMLIPKKVFITVKARIDPDGFMTPLALIWKDRREFPVEKVLQVIPTMTSAGDEALGYTCLIGGKRRTIYLETGRWYVIVQGKAT